MKNHLFKRLISVTIILLYSFSVLASDPVTIEIRLPKLKLFRYGLLGLQGRQAPGKISAGESSDSVLTINLGTNYSKGQYLILIDYMAYEDSLVRQFKQPVIVSGNELLKCRFELDNGNPGLIFGEGSENAIWGQYMQLNNSLRQNITYVEQILANYTPGNAGFMKIAEQEYLLQVNAYNNWLQQMIRANQQRYISHLMALQYINVIDWKADLAERKASLADQWFSGFDFQDTLVLNSFEFVGFVENAVNIRMSMASDRESLDSIMLLTARNLCNLSSRGHPKVYGWFVDYFYTLFERIGFAGGMSVLEKHIQNPYCLTSRKQEILARVEGSKKLKAGFEIPSFEIADFKGNKGNWDKIGKNTGDRLLLFYQSDCGHCQDFMDKLSAMYSDGRLKPEAMKVISISVDYDVEKWKEKSKIRKYSWEDCYLENGFNSKAAADLFLISTPAAFLVSRDNKLIRLIETPDQLLH